MLMILHCYQTQRMIYRDYHLSCLKLNVKVSLDKTKTLTAAKQKLEIDGRMVEQDMKYNYLGVNITSSGNLVN